MQTMRRDLCWLASLVLTVAASGCNKDKRGVPPGPPGLPALSTSAGKGHPARLTHPPMSPMPPMPPMPMDHPPVLQGVTPPNLPPGHPPVPTAEEAAPAQGGAEEGNRGAVIRGVLKLDDKLKDKVHGGETLFVVARAHLSGGTGPVLAAKRLVAGSWPLPFELSDSDVMIAGMSLKGRVVVTARADQDDDAMTKSPGDVEGMSRPIEVPASGVEVVLDTVRTQAAGAPSPPGMGK